jgi:hypothetical protein
MSQWTILIGKSDLLLLKEKTFWVCLARWHTSQHLFKFLKETQDNSGFNDKQWNER